MRQLATRVGATNARRIHAVAPRACWLTLVVALLRLRCGREQQRPPGLELANCSKTEAIQTVTSQSGAYTFYVCDAATPVVGFNNFTPTSWSIGTRRAERMA